MGDTEKLGNMLDNLIDDNSEQAQVDFHDYLRSKMQALLAKSEQDTDEE